MSDTLPRSREGNATRGIETMVSLPDDNKELVKAALRIIEDCRSDQGNRAAYYRQLNGLVETGRQDQTRSLINLLYSFLDRLASHLCSPTDARFMIDFENPYPPDIEAQGMRAAEILTRSFERTNTDMLFSKGVFEALKYGSCFLKQWVTQEGPDRLPNFHSSLVMPWQFGVYRPDATDLDSQPAMCETISLTLPEVWRRIWMMPDAKKLFDRIKQHSASGAGDAEYNSFFHQVLSTSQINTGVQTAQRPVPGGIVQLNTDPNYVAIGPQVSAPMVRMHELWMWDRFDYTTIQIIEPDILIAPRFKRSNLLIQGDAHEGLHPYTRICANDVHGYIWGRSEIVDLIGPQNWLSTTAMDIQRMLGLQIDKVLAFTGDGVQDEMYDQFRAAGYLNLGQGGDVKDLTPKFPQEAIQMMDKIIQWMEMISGFDNILSGRGETGVRSGEQTNTLLKTAGPRLKDRSLLVERQYAGAGDLRLRVMQAKDGRSYWTDPKNIEGSSFFLDDLPDDARVHVDAHSTSPIFADDHQALIMNGLKLGLVDPVSAIESLPFNNRDVLLARHKAKEEQQAKQLAELQKSDPEAYAKVIEHQVSGGRRR